MPVMLGKSNSNDNTNSTPTSQKNSSVVHGADNDGTWTGDVSPTPFRGITGFASPETSRSPPNNDMESITMDGATATNASTTSGLLQPPDLSTNPVDHLRNPQDPTISSATTSGSTLGRPNSRSVPSANTSAAAAATGAPAKTPTSPTANAPVTQFRSRRRRPPGGHPYHQHASRRRKRNRTLSVDKKLRIGDSKPGSHHHIAHLASEHLNLTSSTAANHHHHNHHDTSAANNSAASCCGQKCCCYNRTFVRSTLSFMNFLARVLFWCSAFASVAAVIWYSYELKKHGTDPHLIAWFSAGAFVLLGFPISMYGIVMHLANYNQPNVQAYIVRILWMVPIYSIESWLCLRYKDYAIYIETLRDCYESYVLYSFLQFLIQVLGGEEALILMLKDKSPTRGVHMWGLQWCVKPWLMGQPIRKTYMNKDGTTASGPASASTASTAVATTPAAIAAPATQQSSSSAGAIDASTQGLLTDHHHHHHISAENSVNTNHNARLKRVHWTSPFFVKCKFGVLQYVLLKFVCSIVVMILERNHVYKEGNFTPKGGYLYICILTNLSQCWALYCLIFFYYATKNELGPIGPVGKFLSVKALVFFTWWQSVCISMLYQMDLIPHYHAVGTPFGFGKSPNASPDPYISDQDALNLGHDLATGNFSATATGTAMVMEWTPEDVAKGMQDYLICVEMFIAAIVHIFVFSHTEYDPQAVEARARALNQTPHKDWNKRLGRKWKEWDNKSGRSGATNTSSEMELVPVHSNDSSGGPVAGGVKSAAAPGVLPLYRSDAVDEYDLRVHPLDRMSSPRSYDEEDDDHVRGHPDVERRPLLLAPIESDGEFEYDDDEGTDGSMYSLESGELYDEEYDDEYIDDYNGGGEGHGSEEQHGLELPPFHAGRLDVAEATGDQQQHDGFGPYDHQQQQQLLQQKQSTTTTTTRKPGFVKAFLDSAIPQDLRDNTVGIIKGDYVVEKKTLLHHAATSDSYDLFSRVLNSHTQGQYTKKVKTSTKNSNASQSSSLEDGSSSMNTDEDGNILNGAAVGGNGTGEVTKRG